MFHNLTDNLNQGVKHRNNNLNFIKQYVAPCFKHIENSNLGVEMVPIVFMMKLRKQISHLRADFSKASDGNLAILKQCIEKHCQLTRYVKFAFYQLKHVPALFNFRLLNKLEFHFGPSFLFQSSLISIFLCILTFKMIRSSFLSKFNDFVYFFGFFLVMLLKIGLPCFFGQQMKTESEKILQALYDLPWYDFDLKIAKEVLIMMTRAKKDIQLRVRGAYDMDFMHLREVRIFLRFLKSLENLKISKFNEFLKF